MKGAQERLILEFLRVRGDGQINRKVPKGCGGPIMCQVLQVTQSVGTAYFSNRLYPEFRFAL